MTTAKLHKVDFYANSINEVIVDRWNDKSVWIKGRRYAVTTQSEVFFASYDEAVEALIKRLKLKLDGDEKAYKESRDTYYKKLKELTGRTF